MALELTNENFDAVLIEKNLTMVDFWAPWCVPCKLITPIIDDLYEEYIDKDITIGKVNVDANSKLATNYGIRNIPSILFFKNGDVIKKIVGNKTKKELKTIIDNLLS